MLAAGGHPSTLEVITLVVAIVGVTLAALSLGWQAATFVLSGSRVGVTLRRGGVRREPGERTRVSFPENASERDVGLVHEQGFTEDVAVAEVRNRGRLAISVENVSIKTDNGWGFGRLADPENPALPHRLEPGAKETWHVELAPVQMLVDNAGEGRRVGMIVEFGTGKVVETKKTIVVEPRRA